MDFADWIPAQAGRTPAKPALRCAPQIFTYAELAAHIDSIAAALAAAGAAPGDRVAWLGVNSAPMLATLFACARLGAIFTPLNWRLAPPEHHTMLRECEPSVLCAENAFVDPGLAAVVQPLGTRCVVLDGADAPARVAGRAVAPQGWMHWCDFLAAARSAAPAVRADASAPVLLCFTSGSTGRPKGVLLSQGALAANADASVDMHALTADDRILTTLPLFHVGGLNILTTPALRAGCSVTLHARFDADATFDAIEHERITLTVLVPAQLEAMIAHPRWAAADLSSLRMLSTGSTLVPERLIHAIHARGIPLVQVWGATETAPIAACLHADEAVRHAGAAGGTPRHGAWTLDVRLNGRPHAAQLRRVRLAEPRQAGGQLDRHFALGDIGGVTHRAFVQVRADAPLHSRRKLPVQVRHELGLAGVAG